MRLNTNESPLRRRPTGGSRSCRAGLGGHRLQPLPRPGGHRAAPGPGRPATGSDPTQVFCANGSNEVLQSPAARLRRARAARWPCSSPPTPCTATSPGLTGTAVAAGRRDRRLTASTSTRCGGSREADAAGHHLPLLAQQPHRPGRAPWTSWRRCWRWPRASWSWTRPTASSPPGRPSSSSGPADRGRSGWRWCGPSPRRGRWPGCRLGYLVAAPEVVARLRARSCCRTTSTRPSSWPGAWPSATCDEMEARVAAPQRGAGPDRRRPGRPARRDVAVDANFILFRPAAVPARDGVARPPRPLGARARLFGSGRTRPGACGSRSAPPRRTTASWPPWTKACDDHRPRRRHPHRGPVPPAATKETTIEVGPGPRRHRHHRGRRPACRSSTTWSASSAGTAGFDLTVHGHGRPRRSTPTTRSRTSGSCSARCLAEALGDKAGIRRFASIALPLDEALVEVALDLSGRPFLAYDVEFAAGHQPASGTPPFDPQLAEEFWRAFVTAAGITLHIRLVDGQEHPPHPGGVASRGWPAACATPCGSRAAASPRPRARLWTPTAGDAWPAVIAVLDYGIGNLRSAEKALAAPRRRRPAGRRPGRGRRAPTAWCCPAWAPSAACVEALRAQRPRPGAPPTPSSAGVPFLGICVGLPAALRGLRRGSPAVPGLGVLPGAVAPAARRGEAPADAVEPARCRSRRRAPACWPGRRHRPGSTSSTPTRPELDRRHRRPPATTAAR